jgi:uncharacterized protein YlzI (FlbEa/FlbD family)
MRGTITLINGHKRVAQRTIGQLTGKVIVQYRTPAGNWRNPLPVEAATFVADHA